MRLFETDALSSHAISENACVIKLLGGPGPNSQVKWGPPFGVRSMLHQHMSIPAICIPVLKHHCIMKGTEKSDLHTTSIFLLMTLHQKGGPGTR